MGTATENLGGVCPNSVRAGTFVFYPLTYNIIQLINMLTTYIYFTRQLCLYSIIRFSMVKAFYSCKWEASKRPNFLDLRKGTHSRRQWGYIAGFMLDQCSNWCHFLCSISYQDKHMHYNTPTRSHMLHTLISLFPQHI